MIKATDALSAGRSLLGTPYSTYDCINFIKKIIRTSPGGKSNYQTAGTNALWRSNDLANKRKGITDAKPGEVVFKWKSQDTGKYPDGLGDFHHIGIVTDHQTVMHSSSVENWNGYRYVNGVRQKTSGYYPGGIGAIETDLDSKWTHTATHKLISPEGGKDMDDYLYKAIVVTESSGLRLRKSPVNGEVRTTIPKGATVFVMNDQNPEWPEVQYAGLLGYCSGTYLQRTDDPEPKPEPQPTPDPEPGTSTWGIFIPCESQAAALQLAAFFNVAHVCQKELRD